MYIYVKIIILKYIFLFIPQNIETCPKTFNNPVDRHY